VGSADGDKVGGGSTAVAEVAGTGNGADESGGEEGNAASTRKEDEGCMQMKAEERRMMGGERHISIRRQAFR
jgi:hypothetical protein